MSRPSAFRLWILIWAAPLGLWAQSPPPDAQTAAQVDRQQAIEAITQEILSIFEHSRQAVIRIEAIDTNGPLAGTGFFVDANGTLFTSYTVGGESQEIVVCQKNTRHPARRLTADRRTGIAILKVDAHTPFLPSGNTRQLHMASPVIALGYPMDLPLTPSFGTIGGFDFQHLGRFFAVFHIRANLPVQRGEGGSPLLNMNGEVVGMLIASLDSGSAAFALPIEAAEKVHRDYLRFGEIRHGWIGLHVASSPEPQSGSHARIDETVHNGPAQKAGLQKDDVLLQIGTRKIVEIEDVLDACFYLTASDPVPVRVARDHREIELSLLPEDHPLHSENRPPRPRLPSGIPVNSIVP